MTTNNNVEGFHHAFSSLVGYNNPTIWDWLTAVRDKQTLTANDIVRQMGRHPPGARYQAILSRHLKLKDYVTDYANYDLFEYLDLCNIAM